jgi:hypothetical protein
MTVATLLMLLVFSIVLAVFPGMFFWLPVAVVVDGFAWLFRDKKRLNSNEWKWLLLALWFCTLILTVTFVSLIFSVLSTD